MLHRKLLARFHCDRLRVRLVTLFPEYKCRVDLQLLRDDGLETQHRLLIRGLVSFHRHSFDLRTGAVANVEGSRNLTGLARRNFVLLRLRSSATAGSMNRFEVDRCL